MKFIQYMFPSGRPKDVTIAMTPDIERKAESLWDLGWRFEIECFPDTQMVHMDCCNDERVLANRVCQNGPKVPVNVEELVNEAAIAGGVQ